MRDAAVGHQCPECVAEGRRTQRQPRTAFGASAAGAAGYVTIGLIVLNVIMLLLSAAAAKSSGALYGGNLGGLLGGNTPLMTKLAVIGQCETTASTVVPCGVADGEFHRLLTAMFMHYGAIHLLMNMWALWILGRPLEAMFGPIRFLGIYLVCGLGGDVASYLFQPGALTAGASGAIFGLFAVLFVALRRLRLSASAVLPVIILNLVFTFTVPGISIAGHLGGLVTGALVGVGVAYAPRANRAAIQAAVILGTLALLGLLTVWQTAQLSAA